MKELINEIANIIEKYFVDEVWFSKPPINEKDLKLVVFSTKLYDLLKCNNISINDINTLKEYLINEMNIPKDNVKSGLEEDKKRNNLILILYEKLNGFKS